MSSRSKSELVDREVRFKRKRKKKNNRELPYMKKKRALHKGDEK